MSDFHFPAFLEKIIKVYRFLAKEKGLMFQYEIVTPLPTNIQTDQQRLRQILISLLGNAIKFTSHGHVICRVGLIKDNQWLMDSDKIQRKQDIRFEIEDTGLGLSNEQIDAIFCPFEQLENELGFTEGTGLGLTLSQRVAEMMSSVIQVESKAGQGSTFWFDLEVLIILMEYEISSHVSELDYQTSDVLEEDMSLHRNAEVPMMEKLIVPPSNEIDILYDLAMMGNMQKIKSHAIYVAEKDKQYLPFATKLQKMARHFEDREILLFLEQYIE
ncbi:MAG: hypothetical protein B6242_04775 [Anaerolineaceae bacterium 4572_78]|nr:MAG: hypothetical protein B6242_04775 [Anaerolineaceae bacterium 4572_78]